MDLSRQHCDGYNCLVDISLSPRVTVAVTQRESFHHTFRSLESLFAGTNAAFELVYVDAGSPPWIKARLERSAAARNFRLIRENRFLTPNEARNVALAACTTEYVVFVDNDVLFREQWLERLIACADETGAAVVGPMVCIGDPPFRRVHIAGGSARVEETDAGRRLHEVHRFVDRPYIEVVSELRREPVEMVEFHCMLVRRSLFDCVGTLDEKLSSASEHMDLCLLARNAGDQSVTTAGVSGRHRKLAVLPTALEHGQKRRKRSALS
jgi:GT2 family glycosyltransferase